MKNKFIAVLSAAVITAGTIGGVVFASSIDDSSKINQPIAVQQATVTANPTTSEKTDVKAAAAVKTTNYKLNENYNRNCVNSSSKNRFQDMINIMRDNGFKDAAIYMQTGDYEAMSNYMENLSQADFDKMIEIMNNNGYGYMAQRMQSLGRDGMVQMHNSMRAIYGGRANGRNYGGMMGGF